MASSALRLLLANGYNEQLTEEMDVGIDLRNYAVAGARRISKV